MDVKVYRSGGLIFAEEAGEELKVFTPSGIDLWVSGDQIGFTDSITKEIVKLGDYSDIVKVNGVNATSLIDAAVYLASLSEALDFGEGFRQRVVMGLVPGYSWLDKFGKNNDISTGSAPEDMIEQGGIYPWGNDLGETLYFSSSDNSDTQPIEFLCLTIDSNGNWNRETFTQNLVGQTKTALIPPSGDPVVRCHRMESDANTGDDIAGTVYAYYNSATSVPGVPDDATKILSVIINGANQTKQLTWTMPTGIVGFLIKGEAGVTKSSGTDECDFAYKSRRAGKVFKQKKDFGVMTSGDNFYQEKRSFPDPIPAKTDLTIEVVNVSGNNMGAWGTFDIMLVEEDYLSDAFLTAIGQERRIN